MFRAKLTRPPPPLPTRPLLLAFQEESFVTNVTRLKEYRANLIVFPRGSKHQPKAGDSSVEEQAAATQVNISTHTPHRPYASIFLFVLLRNGRTGFRLPTIYYR